MNEFELISTWFDGRGTVRADVRLAVGDDAALIALDEDQELITTSACTPANGETNGAVNQAPHTLAPEEMACRCYEQALDALLAQQATPAWAILCLTLTHVDPDWLERFATRLHTCLSGHQVQLIGGDTTRGPTAVTLFLSGYRVRQKR